MSQNTTAEERLYGILNMCNYPYIELMLVIIDVYAFGVRFHAVGKCFSFYTLYLHSFCDLFSLNCEGWFRCHKLRNDFQENLGQS